MWDWWIAGRRIYTRECHAPKDKAAAVTEPAAEDEWIDATMVRPITCRNMRVRRNSYHGGDARKIRTV